MILFNTTFSVDANVADAFNRFISDVYVPLAEESKLYSILLTEMRAPAEKNLLSGQPTRTFALQMRAPSAKELEEFRSDVIPEIYGLIGKQWGPAVAMFESTLDVIYDHKRK